MDIMAGRWVVVIGVVIGVGGQTVVCEKYECYQGETENLLLNTCVFFNKPNSTYLLLPCDQHSNMTYCPPITAPGNSTCLPLGPSNMGTAYPGEPCTGDLMCVGGNVCDGGLCVGNSTAEACSDPTDCNVGLTCLNNKCELQKPLGSKCGQDTDCVNNAGCDNSTVCSLYFRLQEGQAVQDCEPSIGNYGWSNMCQSGMCYDGYCLRALNLSSPDSVIDCTDQGVSVCNSTYYSYYSGDMWSLMFHGECQCGMNPTGRAYCSLFPGDPPALQYYQKIGEWMNSTAVNSCHTSRRWDLACIQLYWDKHDFDELQYYAIRYWNFPQIQGIDTCTKAIFFSDYAQAEDLYNAATGLYMGFLAFFPLIIA